MSNTRSIAIVGVGGQGTVLTSDILIEGLVDLGFDVKKTEQHGLSQRGGSVVTYVRFGDKVYSPIIDKGEADFIVSFELLEAARWIAYLKPTGRVVTNTQQMEPMPVIAPARPSTRKTWWRRCGPRGFRWMPWTVWRWRRKLGLPRR